MRFTLGNTAAPVLAGLLALSSGGCGGRYSAPARGADMSEFTRDAQTDHSVRAELAKQPLATLPAAIAVVRVQSSGYSESGAHGKRGRLSVVTSRDVELDTDLDRLAALPGVEGIAPMSRLVRPSTVDSDETLRAAAAGVRAQLLLVYTLDTTIGTEDNAAPLSVFTLGMFPGMTARVNSTAAAVLMDVRNGYVYGVCEHAVEEDQAANAWTTTSAVNQSRRRAERAAFEGLVGEVERMWSGVAETLGATKSGHRP